ncbi:MAG: hypothetical protein LAN64_06150 [Acidobacteriia bacterium]|nr:hypothetical protein [Terriglobia bacterium]
MLSPSRKAAQSYGQNTADLKAKGQGDSRKAVTEALKKDRFVLSGDGADYKLEKPIKTTFADKGFAVDYQVGTINKKPAYVTVIGDQDTLPKSSDLDAAFGDIKSAKTPTGPALFQDCAGERVCVETRIIEGKPVCVKWKCK